MNHHDTPDHENDQSRDGTTPTGPGSSLPLGFWLPTVDRLLEREFEAAFVDLDVTRREWQALNLIAGEVRDERLRAKLDARPGRLVALVDRGWVTGEPGAWQLTETGREAHAHLKERVDGIRARVHGAVSPDDYATTLASLEAIARALGWNESDADRPGRGRFGRRGRKAWGPRHGRGFGPFGVPPFRPGFGNGPHQGHHGGEREIHVHVHLDDRRGHGRGREHGGREHGGRERADR